VNNIKKLICMVRTIPEWRIIINSYLNFGTLYINHTYVETDEKERDGRPCQILKCSVCECESVGFYGTMKKISDHNN